MSIKESGEMYLETIHVLHKSKAVVRSVDVAEHMGYSKPSVSRAVGLLREEGFILIDKDGGITLTESGLELAEKIYDRHTVLSTVLCALGVREDVASEDACRIEHVISDESFEDIKKHVTDRVKKHE